MVVGDRTRRLEAVVWEEGFTHAYFRMRLAEKFLRRSALWARELGVPDERPFFDVARVLDPGAGLEEGFLARVRARLLAAEGLRAGLTYDVSDEALAALDARGQAEVADRVARKRQV